MNRLLIYLSLIILLIGCGNQRNVSVDNPESLNKNQLIGTFIEVSRKIERNKEDRITEYFFEIGEKKYFIKYNEGYVPKEQIAKHLNQKVVIKGEIRNGEWEAATPGSFSNLTPQRKPRKGDYIVINKIYK
jgi:hypothetical protein